MEVRRTMLERWSVAMKFSVKCRQEVLVKKTLDYRVGYFYEFVNKFGRQVAHLVIDNTKVLNLFNDSSCFFLDLGDNFMLSASLFLIPSCSARSHRIISFFIIISYH